MNTTGQHSVCLNGLRPAVRTSTRSLIAVLLLLQYLPSGCAISRMWHRPEPCVFQPGISKEEIFTHLNQNVTGTPQQKGLSSWWCNSAKIHLSGVGVPVPPLSAMVAVQSPRNFRMTVANPLGGREVDIGSNLKEFWVWTKEAPHIAVVKHEDLSLALTQLPMPVHIHPDWMMEVFGVMPLDPDEFQEIVNGPPKPVMELVAMRESPLGEPMERVLKVDVCQGRIIEHSLRRPGGQVIARATLDKYVQTPGSPGIPTLIRLEWPETGIVMTMNLNQTEVNPPALVANENLFTIPHMNGTSAVDIGDLARYRSRHGVLPASGPGTSAAEITGSLFGNPDRIARQEAQDWQGTGKTSLPQESEQPLFDFEVPAKEPRTEPVSAPVEENPFERYRPQRPADSTTLQTPVPGNDISDAPLWGAPVKQVSHKVTREQPGEAVKFVMPENYQTGTEDGQQSEYSAGAWQSSSGRHPLGQE